MFFALEKKSNLTLMTKFFNSKNQMFNAFVFPKSVFFGFLALTASVCTFNGVYAQVATQATLTYSNDSFSGSCPKSQCTMNQSNGRSVSLSTGITNGMNTSSNAQSSPEYNSSSSSTLVLDSPLSNSSFSANDLLKSTYNSSQVSIGVINPGEPIKLAITTSSVDNTSSTAPLEGTTASSNTSSASLDSKANFEATGFSSVQDLRLKGSSVGEGGSTGTLLRSDVTKRLDTPGTIGTANSSSNAQSTMKIQADITKNDFSNAFISSF